MITIPMSRKCTWEKVFLFFHLKSEMSDLLCWFSVTRETNGLSCGKSKMLKIPYRCEIWRNNITPILLKTQFLLKRYFHTAYTRTHIHIHTPVFVQTVGKALILYRYDNIASPLKMRLIMWSLIKSLINKRTCQLIIW